MTNGCICCTLRDDLLAEVRRLAARSGRFDYLLIEGTGIAEPLPVAATFDFRDEEGESLSDVARLDTMVTVVDAANLLKDYSSRFPARSRRDGGRGRRAHAGRSARRADRVRRRRRAQQGLRRDAAEPRCWRARSSARSTPMRKHDRDRFARVRWGEVLDTGLFDSRRRRSIRSGSRSSTASPTTCPRPRNTASRASSTARAALPPAEVPRFLNGDLAGLIRAKGHFWLATRPDWVSPEAWAHLPDPFPAWGARKAA
jgi:G3E family GTPase